MLSVATVSSALKEMRKKSKTEIITQETTSQGTETVYKSNMNKCIFVIHVNELYVNKQLLTFLAFNFFFFT